MDRFRRRGYEVTAMRELTECMGISGRSLYNTFGDKLAIFAAALERYVDQPPRSHVKRLEALLPPKEAIRWFFDEIIEHSLNDVERRGCLLIKFGARSAARSRAEVIDHRLPGRDQAFFCRPIKAAQKQGVVRTDIIAKDVARSLLGVVLGIRLLVWSAPNRALVEGAALRFLTRTAARFLGRTESRLRSRRNASTLR
jgi:TetR/AcrR family transcriptional regulator, transcriptional repressor for nem operon